MEGIELLLKEYFYEFVPTLVFLGLVVVSLLFFVWANRIRYPMNIWQKRICLLFTVAAMVVLFVLCRREGIQGIRIWHYWKDMGQRHDKMEMYLHGFIADVLLFIPLGFVVRWQRLHFYPVSMFLTVGLIGAAIEVIQFVTAHGCIAVSDFLAYLIGGAIGLYIGQAVCPGMLSFDVDELEPFEMEMLEEMNTEEESKE